MVGDNVGGGGYSSYYSRREATLEIGPAREVRKPGEKRTGHGVLDYIGFVGDSCHDRSEKRFDPLCGDGHRKARPSAVAANKSPSGSPADANVVDFNNVVDPVLSLEAKNGQIDAAGLDALTNTVSQAVAKPDQIVNRGTSDIAGIKDGLERAFSRSFPESNRSVQTGGTALQ
jgi:hypothetical protein